MVKHIVTEGNLQTAQLALLDKGGQLFPARDQHGPYVITRGSLCTTYWPHQSPRRGMTMELAKKLDYDPDVATTGRLVRFLLRDVLGEPYKDTYFCQKWRGLAIKGNHWHYLYCKPGRYEYVIEIDLKSAYWSAFANEKSMLYSQHKEWLDDGGALESLKVIIPQLPKNFRLALLGSIASWRNTYWIKDKKDPTGQNMLVKTANEIKYGAAFNAVHRAILKVWKMMEAIHKLTGDDCLRIHTDGVVLDCMNGMPWEHELDSLITRHGYDYSVKANGNAWLLDVNTGIIGKKIMGPKRIVLGQAREAGIKISLSAQPPKPSIYDRDELPASEGTEIDMNPGGVGTQTSLALGVNGIV